MPGKINMIGKDGRVVGVRPEYVNSYLLLGYREEQPEEVIQRQTVAAEADKYGSLEQQALTAVEGGLSGATIGLSDVVEGALFGQEGMQGRAQHNPGLRLGSEVLGAVIPALFSDGATLAASEGAIAARQAGTITKILSKAPTSVATRSALRLGERVAGRGVAGKVVAGAAEGAMFGAGGELTRTQLTGDPLTVEGIFAGAGMGLAFGGVIGGLAGGLEKAGSFAASRQARRLEQETLDAMAGRPRVELPHEYSRSRKLVVPEAPPNPFPDATSTVEARAMASEGILPRDRYEPFRGAVRDLRDVSKRLVKDAEAAHDAAVKAGKAVDRGHIVMPGEGVPAGFNNGSHYNSRKPSPVQTSVPDYGTVDPNARYSIRPSDLSGRKVLGTATTTAGEAGIEAGFQSNHKFNPIDIDVLPDGTYVVLDGNHRLAVASKTNRPVAVRFKAVDKNPLPSATPVEIPSEAQMAGGAGNQLYSEAVAAGFKSAEGASYKSQAASLRAHWGHLQKAIKAGEPGKISAQLAKYTESVATLAKAMGKVDDTAGKAVSKSVEGLTQLQHATDQLHTLLPETADGLFSLGKDKAEQLFAATEAVMKSKLPEAVAVQGTLKSSLAAMAEHLGVISKDASPVAQLRSTWAAGQASRESAAKGWLASKEVQKTKIEFGHLDRQSDVGSRYKNPDSLYPSSRTKQANKAPKVELDPEVNNSGAGYIKNYLIRKAAGAAVGAVVGQSQGASTASSAAFAIMGALMAGKAGTLGRITEAASKIAGKSAKVVQRGAKVPGLVRSISGMDDPGKDLRESFAKRGAEIRELAGNAKNQAFMAAMAFKADGHPEFAVGVYNHAVKLQALLQKRLPKDPPGTRWGTEYLWTVPPEQLAVFEQEYQAITDPASFIEEAVLAPGQVFPSAVASFAEAWPALYSQFRAEGLINVAMKGTKGMSHGDLTAYGVLLSAQLIPTSAPEFIQDTVAMFSPENQPPQPKPGKPGQGTNNGPGSEATHSQLIENRGSLG